MKSIIRYSLIASLCCFSSAVKSQNLEGTWNGFIVTVWGNAKVQYRDSIKFSVEIFSDKGKMVCTTYSKKDDFIGIAEAKIKFDSSKQRVTITETKLIAVSEKGVTTNACLMRCVFRYRKSGEREEMIGSFTSKTNDAKDCGSGDIYIRKAKEERKPD